MSVEPRTPGQRDLVVLSHLRWDWVWQRPQHLVSRLARDRRTWFVEEPRVADVTAPRIAVQEAPPVTRVWLEVPDDGGEIPEYGGPAAKGYAELLAAHLGTGSCDAWLYTATALPLAEALAPRLLVYDVMDDLAAFADAPPHFEELYRRALDTADLVFTGGRSLYASAVQLAGPDKTHRFSSGVEIAHYASSRSLRSGDGVPVAGYVGVVDERLDLGLLADLAAELPDWVLRIVGPVAKVSDADLPRADNIEYLGMRAYAELPEVMAGFTVALMPFALNAATRSISPTKTLEYLAAGLPVVSTRVPDVVADWGDVVHLADTAAEFAAGCREVREDSVRHRDRQVAPLAGRYEWDNIVADMQALMDRAARSRESSEVGA